MGCADDMKPLTHLAMGHPSELFPSLPVYTTFSIRMASPFSPYLQKEDKQFTAAIGEKCLDSVNSKQDVIILHSMLAPDFKQVGMEAADCG